MKKLQVYFLIILALSFALPNAYAMGKKPEKDAKSVAAEADSHVDPNAREIQVETGQIPPANPAKTH